MAQWEADAKGVRFRDNQRGPPTCNWLDHGGIAATRIVFVKKNTELPAYHMEDLGPWMVHEDDQKWICTKTLLAWWVPGAYEEYEFSLGLTAYGEIVHYGWRRQK